jgi:(p)ppGpp synthase/HD superfamily hydrolase
MQKFKSLPDAIVLAEFAHRNQLDKAGLPYIEHPKRVLAKVQAQGALPYVQIAAVLHDVTEDTAFTFQMLLDLGFSEAAVNVVMLLDRDYSKHLFDSSPSFGSTINESDFYYGCIRENAGAKLVKLADIEDNLSPWRQSYLPEETQKRLQAKYAHAKLVLEYGVESALQLDKAGMA